MIVFQHFLLVYTYSIVGTIVQISRQLFVYPRYFWRQEFITLQYLNFTPCFVYFLYCLLLPMITIYFSTYGFSPKISHFLILQVFYCLSILSLQIFYLALIWFSILFLCVLCHIYTSYRILALFGPPRQPLNRLWQAWTDLQGYPTRQFRVCPTLTQMEYFQYRVTAATNTTTLSH